MRFTHCQQSQADIGMDIGDRTPVSQLLPEASGHREPKYIGTIAGAGAVAQLKPPLRRVVRRVLRQLGEVAVHALRVFGIDASEAGSWLGDDE